MPADSRSLPTFASRRSAGMAKIRPAAQTIRPWIYLVLAPLVILTLTVAWEAKSGRSIASWFVKDDGSAWQAHDDSLKLHPGSLGGNSSMAEPGEDEQSAAERELAALNYAEEMQHEEYTRMAREADELQLWKLQQSMMYWTHSNPVPSESRMPRGK